MHIIYSDSEFSKPSKSTSSIFLAGPSPRGYGEGHPPDWRDDAIKVYEQMEFSGRLFIPRPSTGVMGSYDNQIEWELHHLDIADTILFWVPRKYPSMKGMTTNVEFCMWVKDPKIIYGRPDWAEQVRYLDHLYKKYLNRTPYNELTSLVKQSIILSSISRS